jgi:Spy/CpxP family protein refolding chaperone
MLRKSLFFCAVLLTVSAIAFAQDQGQGQGGRRGGRGRGMGRMGPGGMFGGAGMNLMLVNNEKVQKELEITPEQKTKIEALGKEMRSNMPDFGGLRDLSDDERQAKMEENRKKMEKVMQDAQAKLKEILLPNQLDRLNQIRIQAAGTMILMDPAVQKDLGITDDQKAKMKTINDDARKQGRKLFENASPEDRQANMDKMQKLRKETDEKVMDILTADQKTKLEKMKGEKFDTSSLFQFGPPNRGDRRPRNPPPPAN